MRRRKDLDLFTAILWGGKTLSAWTALTTLGAGEDYLYPATFLPRGRSPERRAERAVAA